MPVWMSLGLQGLALVLLYVGLRGRLFRHIGAVFILVAVIFHGLSELVISLDPSADTFRAPFGGYIGPLVANWLTLVSPAILLCTITYLFVLGRTRHDPGPPQTDSLRLLDWRIVAVAVVPLYALTVLGKVQASSQGIDPIGANYLASGLTAQFLLLGVVVLSYGLITTHNDRWTIPVLVGQSAALALLGERFTVIAAGLLLLFALARAGKRPSRKVVGTLVVLAVVLGVAISASRSVVGRTAFAYGSDSQTRASALLSGLGQIGSPATRHQVAVDYVYRFDANTYPALILDHLRHGSRPTGMAPISNDLAITVPRFLNPTKLGSSLATRDDGSYLSFYYGLPLTTDNKGNVVGVNYLAGMFGVVLALGGVAGLLGASVLLGVFFGFCDRWLKRQASPVSFLIALGLMYCVLLYEQGVGPYPIVGRGVLVVATGIALLGFVRRMARKAGGIAEPAAPLA